MIKLDNYIIETSIEDILKDVKVILTNGKLALVKRTTSGISVTCPFHSDGHEHKNSCYITDEGIFHCFTCGEKGGIAKFIAACLDSSIGYATHWLVKKYGKLLENSLILEDEICLPQKQSRTSIDSKILDQYQDWCPYLAQRKLSRETCKKFNIKYDSYHRQIVFPCYNLKGEIIMLPRRSIDTKQFYLDKNLEKPLYCFDYIVKNNIKSALVVEGLIDTLTGYEYGVPTFGLLGSPNLKQIQQINQSCLTELIIATDNDTSGETFRAFIKKNLHPRILTLDLYFPPAKKDINDLSKDEFLKLFFEVKNLSKNIV